MAVTDPGDRLSLSELNPHDILHPVLTRSGWNDRSAHLDGRDRFMEANAAMVDALGVVAEELLLLQVGDATLESATIELPSANLPHGRQTFIFGDHEPYYAMRLTLDHEAKQQSANAYFVHPVSELLYERPESDEGLPDFKAYLLLGLVERSDSRDTHEYDPPYALAISRDCRHVRILPRVSDEEYERRLEADEVSKLANKGRTGGKESYKQLRREALEDIRNRMRDPRLSRFGNLALVELLGQNLVAALTAYRDEESLLGIGADGALELMVKPIGYIALEKLFEAQALLDQPESFEP